jgi:hypothetical protein
MSEFRAIHKSVFKFCAIFIQFNAVYIIKIYFLRIRSNIILLTSLFVRNFPTHISYEFIVSSFMLHTNICLTINQLKDH